MANYDKSITITTAISSHDDFYKLRRNTLIVVSFIARKLFKSCFTKSYEVSEAEAKKRGRVMVEVYGRRYEDVDST